MLLRTRPGASTPAPLMPESSLPGITAGRVVHVDCIADHSELTVRLRGGRDVRVVVGALPDADRGRHALTGMRRMPHVELYLAGSDSDRDAKARLSATLGRQHEVHRRISVGTALALARYGAPTQVLVDSSRCREAS